MTEHKRVALIMSYSSPLEENRLRTQVMALLDLGFEVHTFGLGELSVEGVTKHIGIPVRNQNARELIRNLVTHIRLKPEERFQVLRVPSTATTLFEDQDYSLVVAHDLELLPLSGD